MAPLAGPSLPPSAGGPGHVHPHIAHQDQLPQHQADSRCVTLCRLCRQCTTEAAFPSSTAFPWVHFATLALGVQEKGGRDQLSSLEGKESYGRGL